MKRFYITSIIFAVLFAACTNTNTNVDIYFDKEVIAGSEATRLSESVIVDRNTGVLYYANGHRGYTPIYNADGTLKTINDIQ